MRVTSPEPQVFAIRSDESLPLSEFMARTKMGRHAVRACRRQGLKVRKVGCRKFVLGSDWHEFLANQETQ